jgi:hypothetical protein
MSLLVVWSFPDRCFVLFPNGKPAEQLRLGAWRFGRAFPSHVAGWLNGTTSICETTHQNIDIVNIGDIAHQRDVHLLYHCRASSAHRSLSKVPFVAQGSHSASVPPSETRTGDSHVTICANRRFFVPTTCSAFLPPLFRHLITP